jgi:hypothetical protein
LWIGGAYASAEGARPLGVSRGMPPGNILKFGPLKWPQIVLNLTDIGKWSILFCVELFNFGQTFVLNTLLKYIRN